MFFLQAEPRQDGPAKMRRQADTELVSASEQLAEAVEQPPWAQSGSLPPSKQNESVSSFIQLRDACFIAPSVKLGTTIS
jgi:hypothetical protein